jgi:ABC-type branched-subunit amino acid transport system permease subunit
MTELQIRFAFEVISTFIIIASISTLALGRAGLWVIGQAAFVASGGFYAWAAFQWSPAMAIGVAVLALLALALLNGCAAAFFEGDRLIVVSLGLAYLLYTFFNAKYGTLVNRIPGTTHPLSPFIALSALAVLAAVTAAYVWGLSKSGLNAVLLIARDHRFTLSSGRWSVPAILGSIAAVSVLPIGLTGIIQVFFHGDYSPERHQTTLVLFLFAAAIPFGLNSLGGAVVSALTVVTLRRFVDLVLASDFFAANGLALTSLSQPVIQLLLAGLLLFVVRVRPRGFFGTTRA